MNTKPVITRSASPIEVTQFLEDQLTDYNRGQIGKGDGQQFAFLIRDDQQEIVAGLAGWTWAQACEISDLWVHPACRGQGYGQALLEAAEAEALAHACKVILISSYSFQAPAYYQKYGYEIAWHLDDFPPGHQYFFLVKRFANGITYNAF